MSRIGKQPVLVPSGVECKVNGSTVDVKVPKGQLSRQLHPNMKIELKNNTVTVVRPTDSRLDRSLHGLTRTYDWLMGYEGFLDLAEDYNFMVVTPLGYTRKGWYGSWSRGLDKRSLEKEGLFSEKDVMNVLR